ATVSNLDTNTGSGGTQNSGQTQEQGSQRQQYTIVSGDMLSVLCRRFYGNGTAEYYNALAKYNGIANPHLIYPGTTITIPPADELLGR
ncbi:MAG: LysM peptidoglycan-binding domain-containing protein, partial [Oscillospiraceae bacterium]|nr:LysM peptidoglycan-binding domain-containing protein [Oscillospiraceae bacterium]